MSVLTKHRFSTQEYYRLAETGVLRPEERVELLDGEIFDMSPIGPFHGGVVNRLIRLCSDLGRGRWLLAVQNPVHLDDHSEPQPDLMLLKPVEGEYTSRHPCPEDVLLLVEVSDTSLGYDRKSKLPVYGRAGIPEVWIVNLENHTLEVYRQPSSTGYSSRTTLRTGKRACSLAFPDLTVDVAELLKQV